MRETRVETESIAPPRVTWRNVCLIVVLATMVLGLMGCASSSRRILIRPKALNYNSPVDSLGLADFDSLPEAEKNRRRALAVSWRSRADAAQTAEERLRALRNVVGLTPDDSGSWVDLAASSRWFGWRREAGRYLFLARQGEGRLDRLGRRDLRQRIALGKAWLDYDRGQWRRGKALIDSASVLHGPGRETMLVRGLLLAGAEQSWDATFLAREIEEARPSVSDWRWIRSIAEYYRNKEQECVQLFGQWADPLHRAEFWNDHGMAHERFGLPDLAKRSYERSFESLPMLPSITIEKFEPKGLRGGTEKALPVWLVFGRYYVIGSRPTCVEILYEKYCAAESGAARNYWADLVLEESEVCFRHRLDRIRMRAIRGHVQLDLELYGMAENNLRQVIDETRQQGAVDIDALARLGHLLLVGDKYNAALTLLQEVVELRVDDAAAWSDLGFAQVMLNDMLSAEKSLDRALELDSESATAWYNRGLLNFNLQIWEKSVEDFDRAAALAPENDVIVEMLQRARQARHREERGRRDR